MKALFSALLYLLLLNLVAGSQPRRIDKEKFFTDETILPVTLVTSMNRILNNHNLKSLDVYPARFTCQLPDSTVINEQVRVVLRGHLRRDYCFMPPLKVMFKSKDSAGSVLSPLKTLKMVNGCMLGNVYSQYILMEFLIYKIFNLLSEKSFRARLLEVTYIDSSGKKKPIKNYAFFIEDVKDMAKRNSCKEYTAGRPKSETTNRKHMTLVALFQYMIGNTDWSVTVRHNIRTIIPKEDSTAPPFVVPYDFDYSGIINTNYAVPADGLDIKSVEERAYRGYPRTMEELNEAIAIFNKQKDSIYSLINNFDLLTKQNKRYMTDYLDEFYHIIKDPASVKFTFINGARTE